MANIPYSKVLKGVRNLSPTMCCALFLFHDVRSYDPEWRMVRGPVPVMTPFSASCAKTLLLRAAVHERPVTSEYDMSV